MWRIPDGKVGERSVFMFRAPRWYPLSVSVKDRSFGPSEQVQLCKHIRDLWGTTNLVASSVAELDDTLSYPSGV
jgi:hypothetical protein